MTPDTEGLNNLSIVSTYIELGKNKARNISPILSKNKMTLKTITAELHLIYVNVTNLMLGSALLFNKASTHSSCPHTAYRNKILRFI